MRHADYYIDYESVISSVGNILLAYDSDGAVPVFGFGCKLSGSCKFFFFLRAQDLCFG